MCFTGGEQVENYEGIGGLKWENRVVELKFGLWELTGFLGMHVILEILIY